MTDPVFRPDIQDALLRLLFDKHRINLLKVPREDLQPGKRSCWRGAVRCRTRSGPSRSRTSCLAWFFRRWRATRASRTSTPRSRTARRGGSRGYLRVLPGAVLAGRDPAEHLGQGGGERRAQVVPAVLQGHARRHRLRRARPGAGAERPDLSFVEGAEAVRIFAVVDVLPLPGDRDVLDGRQGPRDRRRGGGGGGGQARPGPQGAQGGGRAGQGGRGHGLAFGVRLMELVRRDDGPGCGCASPIPGSTSSAAGRGTAAPPRRMRGITGCWPTPGPEGWASGSGRRRRPPASSRTRAGRAGRA